MSWSVSFAEPIEKRNAAHAIDKLGYEIEKNYDQEMSNLAAIDQLQAARDVAKMLLKSVPGPYVMVRLNGHANGVGFQAKPGWANDTIQVSVTQLTEEDMKRYYKS